MSNPRHSFLLSYVDMLFAILLGIFTIFILNFLLINPKTELGKKIDMKAELLIVMTWDDQSADDIDLWVLTPENQKIGYNSKENTYMALERDDLGLTNDVLPSGEKPEELILLNREVTTIRAKHPGHYVVNTWLFERKQHPKTNITSSDPIPVRVELVQINPVYKILAVGSTVLKTTNQELTSFSFDVSSNGKVENISHEFTPFILLGDQ